MYRDILTNKWVLGGVGFLIVLSVACVLWYQHDIAPEKKAAADAQELLRQWELSQATDTDSVAGQVADASVESSTLTAEKPITERTVPANAKDVVSDAPQSGAAGIPSVENTEPVRMSPHGFGPYPEIPEGAPIAAFHESDSVQMELILRVAVKAWNEGERFRGASGDGITEKVYLHYPNTMYVWYTTVDNGDGTFSRRISRGKSGNDVNLSEEQIRTGNIPPGIRIIEMDEGGIDPYEFLGLPR